MMFRKLFIFLLVLGMATGIAGAAIPIKPHEFHGIVTIGEEPAPAGTTILAKMWGMPQGQFITTSPGVYGGPSTFDERLMVDADEYESCCTSCGCSLQIEFYVNGMKAQVKDVVAGTGWTGSYLFQPGASTQLNLNTGASPTPTPAPTANFTYACGQFTDTSLNNPTSWSWEFGDGTTSTEQNPAYSYAVPGTYVVNLTVCNECGCSSISKEILTQEPPKADFGIGEPTSGPAPLYVQFSDNSSGNPTSWLWEYNSGTGWTLLSTEQNPNFTFTVPGIYSIRLTASNNCGSDSMTREECIQAELFCPVPVANFTASPTNGPVPLIVQFEDTSQNNPTSWHWEFGDGNSSTLRHPQYTYSMPGTYTVNLTVSNACGSDFIQKTDLITVQEPIPPLSHTFFGNITLYDQPAPVGTTITAVVTGGGGFLVTTGVGSYGADGTNLVVQGWIQDGWPIAFFANGFPAECRDIGAGGDWMGSYPYSQGGHTNLDLRVTGAQQPPVANFTANQTTGQAPLNVQFNDTSLNDPTSWSWEFGDGNAAQVRNPGHTYSAAGNYTVNLTVTNACGSDTISKVDVITVDPPCPAPIANFTIVPPSSGPIPLTIPFTDTSLNNPTSWLWEFGDGATSTLQNPDHVYTIPGTYTVNLTVANACGEDTISKVDVITAGPCPTPIANFTVVPPSSGPVPLTISFTDASLNNPTSWLWEFGDGATSTLQNPDHVYTIPGTYTVNLTVANDCGEDTISKFDVITAEPPCPAPIANFTVVPPSSGPVPLTIPFTDTSLNNPTSWLWEFGDGATSTLQNPDHVYTIPGTYTVNLTVTNACDSDTISKVDVITAEPPCPAPIANFTHTCGQFTDTSTGSPISWSWEFGDGATSTEQNPVHTYTEPGTYVVNLTVCNDCGCGTDTLDVFVEGPPIVNISANQTAGCAPLTIHFTGSSTGDPHSWSWDFGDGSTSTAQHPVHTYVEPGTYTVTLTVCNQCGCGTDTLDVFVEGPPVADFWIGEPTSGPAPLYVQFSDNSSGNPTSWLWEYNSGTGWTLLSTEQNPNFTFTVPGIYSIRLTASNNCGSDSITRVDYIHVSTPHCPEPVPNFTADPTSGKTDLTVQFTDLSLNDPTAWFWEFGDGTTNSTQHPEHTYKSPGFYSVTLTAGNGCGTSSVTKADYIHVSDVGADFIASPLSGKAPLIVRFTDLSQGPVTSWNWDFNNDGIVDSSQKNPFTIYSTPGSYTVTLTVSGPQGNDTMVKTDYITVTGPPPSPPRSNFLASPTTGNHPMTVQFTDRSFNNPSQWAWDLTGDGIIDSTDKNPTWTYTTPGKYTVTLTVSNAGGSNTMTRRNYITVNAPVTPTPTRPPSAPRSNFLASPTTGGIPMTVQFTDLSFNNPTEWAWDLTGDGIIDSTDKNPTWTYTTPGKYTVTLTVSNAGGSNTMVKRDYITVRGVNANFKVSPIFGGAPLMVQFTDTSSGSPTSWEWDFNGDGLIDSNEQNPAWTYTTPRRYTVTLTASNDASSDTEIKRNAIWVM